jgi:hypothetical protein
MMRKVRYINDSDGEEDRRSNEQTSYLLKSAMAA